MKINGRYKLAAKKKYCELEMPVAKVRAAFKEAIKDGENKLPIVGSVDPKTGIFKILYKISDRKGDVYENYCLLVELKELEPGITKIEYDFVFDKAMCYYTKFLSAVCILAPAAAALLAILKYHYSNLWLYIPLSLVALFGVFSLFGFREKKRDIMPVIKEFENLIVSVFSDKDQAE